MVLRPLYFIRAYGMKSTQYPWLAKMGKMADIAFIIFIVQLNNVELQRYVFS